jgi:hypothetical protein
MYDPRVGQFLEEDPIGFDAGDENLRRYVRNNPLSASDPTGLAESEVPRPGQQLPGGGYFIDPPMGTRDGGPLPPPPEKLPWDVRDHCPVAGEDETEADFRSEYEFNRFSNTPQPEPGQWSQSLTGAVWEWFVSTVIDGRFDITVSDNPISLAKVPLPAAGAGTILPVITNVPMAWYRRPYGFAPFLPQKPNIIKNVGEVTPTNCGIALTGVMSGNHQGAGRPLAANSYFGVTGAGPCIGVVVVCPGQVVAFHFSAMDDAGATLGKYAWPANCNAVICGGDNSAVSNDQLVEVINSLKQNGIKLDGIIDMDGCYYGPGGKWYVGSTTRTSQDTRKK